jgi:hypothetical protein
MILGIKQVESHKPPGRPSKLSLEDQLLMTLEYRREELTYFHIGQSWGVNEQRVELLKKLKIHSEFKSIHACLERKIKSLITRYKKPEKSSVQLTARAERMISAYLK